MAQDDADDRGEFGLAYLRYGHGNRSPEPGRCSRPIRLAGVRVARPRRFAGDAGFAEMRVMCYRRPAGIRDARSAETPANLVPHLFPELFPARRPFLFVDIEAVENVEIFQDRMTIACHRQNAKLFGRRPAGASDLPFADRVGACAGREATQLGHFSRRQASANGITEILAELLQFGARHLRPIH